MNEEFRETKYYEGQIFHYCPGCNECHGIAVEKPFSNGAQWQFDGNLEKPTFTPSINIRIGPFPDDHPRYPGKIKVCHYFLKEGRLQYLDDCTHDYKGQTIDLQPIPESERK